MKTYEYSTKDLLNIDVDLYSINENINWEETKEEILTNFISENFELINNQINKICMELVKIEFYSPKYYNYTGNDLSFFIKIQNIDKVLKLNKDLKFYDKKEEEIPEDINFSIEDMKYIFENYVKEIKFDKYDYIHWEDEE